MAATGQGRSATKTENPENSDDERGRAESKRPLSQRLLDPLREPAALAGVLVTRPRDFPRAAHEALRRGFRKVWSARGGGLYATGFFITFVWLEIRLLAEDLMDASDPGDFILGQLAELLLRFTVESFINTLEAFFWPLYLIAFEPPAGFLVLAALYVVFPLTLKKPIERWLFDEPVNPAPGGDSSEKK